MKILPSLTDSFPSSKTPEEICAILQSVTSSPKLRFFQSCNEEFIGEVTPSDFRITGNISYRNSFLPRITGTISPDGYGSQIMIKMHLHPFVSVFCSIWLGFMALSFLFGLLISFTDGSSQAWFLPVSSAGMFAFSQVLIRLGFFLPARKTQRRIRELIQ